MKRVALLGGSRFIGYHLLLALLKKEHKITLYNRGESCPPSPFPDNVEIIKGNRNRPKDLNRLFNKDYDVVFDLSGYTSSHIEPIINRFQPRIGHYIFCSTTAVYSRTQNSPLNEESSRDFTSNTYGGEKALAEDLLMNKSKETNWPVTIFRPNMVFGSFDPGPPTRKLRFLFNRINQSLPIPINPENKVRFNLLHVDDLVRAFILASENPNSHNKFYCVASDNYVTELDLIKLSAELCVQKPILHVVNDPDYNELKIGSPWPNEELLVDNTKIKKDLGINFTKLNITINNTFDWFRKTPNYYGKTEFRGEKYILKNLMVPRRVKLFWKCIDWINLFIYWLYQFMWIKDSKPVLLAKKILRKFL